MEDLSLVGYTNWRLPEHKELAYIVDYGTYSPSIDETYFPNTNSSLYWSSTTRASNTSYAWNVYFYNGNDGNKHSKSDDGRWQVRARARPEIIVGREDSELVIKAILLRAELLSNSMPRTGSDLECRICLTNKEIE